MAAKRFLAFLLIILFLAIISIFYSNPTGNVSKQTNADFEQEQAVLIRVIDGDTIVVTGEKIGNNTHIRLLGINTPEKNRPFSNAALDFLRQFENKTIILESDFEDIDKYKRKLRYIFFNNKSRFLNLEILENGFANAYYFSGLKYEQEILRAEKQARNLELGIWKKSEEKCAVENCINLISLNCTAEFFIIRNTCSFSCNLDGWFVKDAGRNTFYISNLSSEQEKTYFSKNNTDVWNNDHDKFFMFDKKGLLVIYYEY